MTRLDDAAVARLREAVTEPDLSGTRYRILSLAGRGGMARVYVAEDALLSRKVALKILDDAAATGAQAEALLLARLEHPGIVPVHDAGTLPDGRAWYAMKLVDGERLDQALPDIQALSERLRIFLQLCETVAFAHARSVIHRDLKPQNIMLGSFGEVLVLDWGLARPLGEQASRERAGTPGYIAPDAQNDALDDIYSLGAILSGMPPLPAPVQAIERKAMAARAQRYSSVAALAADVEKFLEGKAIAAAPERPWQTLARMVVNNRVAIGVLGAYVLGRALIFFFAGR